MPVTQRPPITADERLARQIRVEIESGRLPHGTLLPPTKALASEYNASASTVSRAIGLLVDEGLVLSSARSGRVVNYPNADGDEDDAKTVVLFIGGVAGSGKTELGRIIARRKHWAMLDKDSTTRPVVEVALTTIGLSANDRDSETYRTVIRPAEYDALMMGLEENLECGTSCIVTAPFVTEFGDPAWCERTRSLVASHGGTAHFVWVSCDVDTMLSYIRKRGAARDAKKLADWPAWVASLDLNFRPATEHFVIDNSAGAPPLQRQADTLLTKVTR
ncbi:transcriptional regulator [Streptomyces sp. WAC 05977]|nr:transcriptional regulator [Streptomyces sp. WAC 05977]